jgi:putative hydrolase of the HAD superfamily
LFRGIKAVFFDLDGTLRHNEPSFAQIFEDYISTLDGFSNTWDNRRRAMRWEHHYWASSPDLATDREKYDGDDEGFWLNYNRRRMIVYGFHPKRAAELAPRVQEYMDSQEPENRLYSDAIPTIQFFRQRGLKVGLVSNRNNPIDDLVAEMGLGEHLDFYLISRDVNAWKPDPAIFGHALLRSATASQETIYVGDNYYADVVGARRAGLHPVLLDPMHIFDEPGCPVISSLAQVIALVES